MHIRNNKGFSLVELMVVVAIIGILAAIAVPNFQRFTAKSKQSEAKAVLSALYGSEKAFQSEWQIYAGGFNAIGYRPTGWLRYNHGFAGAGPAMPPGYTGVTDAANFNTQVFCGFGALNAVTGCGVINSPVVPTNPPTNAVTPTATLFTAAAIGDISGGAAGQDNWTVDQMKQFKNPTSGLP